MENFIIMFTDMNTGKVMARMPIQAVDYDTAQTIAEDMNSSFNVYVAEA